jgi:recombinational DNA repair protein RecR
LIFVLGGNIPVIEKKNKTEKIKLGELLIYIKNLMLTTPTPPYQGGDNAVLNKEILEVLLCNSATADGFYTANFIADEIKKLNLENIKITTFGRGFSTGTELEYVDKDTLDHAMRHREIL